MNIGTMSLISILVVASGRGTTMTATPKATESILTGLGAVIDHEDADDASSPVRFATLRGKQFTDGHAALLVNFPKLFSVTLEGTSVTGTGFEHWGQLRDLHMFDCENSPLGDQGLRNLSLAPNIHEIRLTGVDISENGWESLATMKLLDGLSIHRARSTDSGVKHMASSMAPLEGIELDGVPVGDAGVAVLAHFKSLRSVSLNGTLVTDAGLAALAHLDNMEELWIDQCKITGVGVRHLFHLAKLRLVSMNNSRLNDDGLREAARLPSLKDIRANGTPITDQGLSHLCDARLLDTLLANDTSISDQGLKQLAGLHALKDLQLNRTRISGEGLTHLAKLDKIERLAIEGTRVNSAGMRHLARMKRLSGLWIEDTDVDDSGLLLLSDLPKLNLRFMKSKFITEAGRVDADLKSAYFKTHGYARLQRFGGTLVHSKRSGEWVRMELTGPKVDDSAIIREGLLFIPTPSPFELDLKNSRVGAAGVAAVCETSKALLRELDLGGTPIDDEALASLAYATDLISLSLDDTRITNKATKIVGALPKLEHLSLRNTRVDASALKDLEKLPFLTEVDIRGTNISAADAERFHSLLRRRASSH
jgi:internalin A